MPRLIGAVVVMFILASGSPWLSAAPPALARQDAAFPVIEVGAGPIGEPSWRLVGRSLYDPGRVALFGYLTAATNLGPDTLFAGPLPDVANARFTFAADIAIAEPVTRADVRSLEGEGELRVYLDDGGADWSDPASFADGEIVAEFSLQLRETVQRQDPTVGVVVGDGGLTQEVAAEFSLADTALRFGNPGITSRLRYTGALIADATVPPGAAAAYLGALIVTAREARPVPLGAGAEPAS